VIEAPTNLSTQQPIEHSIEPVQVVDAQPLRVNVERVALPHENPEDVVTPDILGLEENRVFASEKLTQVPLPDLDELISSLPVIDEIPANDEVIEQQVTSELDDLISSLPELPEIELQQETLPPAVSEITSSTPELPDLDGFF
jgi:hypothetical protein